MPVSIPDCRSSYSAKSSGCRPDRDSKITVEDRWENLHRFKTSRIRVSCADWIWLAPIVHLFQPSTTTERTDATMAKQIWAKVIEFRTGNVAIRFEPVSDVPGFSHMVVIVKSGQFVAKDWLSDESNPTQKNAEYYFDKHSAKMKQKPLQRNPEGLFRLRGQNFR